MRCTYFFSTSLNRVLHHLLLLTFFYLINYNVVHAQSKKIEMAYDWLAHPEQIASLESIIQQAEIMALDKGDYNVDYLNACLTKQVLLPQKKDSLKADSIIHKVAMKFFTDLAYGKAPNLEGPGMKFKQNAYNVNALILSYLKQNTLPELVSYFQNNAYEVSVILNTIKLYQDSLPLKAEKVRVLIKAANEYRWLHAISKNQRIILVNLPSAQLKVYENNHILIDMKLVVGKASTPSHSLSSMVRNIIVNPYWTVPNSIAVKEMLPQLRKSRYYADRIHLEVLSSNGKVLNADNIDWYSVDPSNFPYTLRQSTGCDNSLGVLKLDFDSRFGIFLHDTPEKSLFNYNKRFFSHGCMRMEKPIQMAKLLMDKNPIALDSIDLEKCYKNPNPIVIPLPVPTPLVVWYSLVDFDSKGNLIFFNNVYHRSIYY